MYYYGVGVALENHDDDDDDDRNGVPNVKQQRGILCTIFSKTPPTQPSTIWFSSYINCLSLFIAKRHLEEQNNNIYILPTVYI
jgi:hypothetical protein